MLQIAQGYSQYILYMAYESEESELTNHVKCVPIPEVLFDANIVSSHTIYKIKVEEKHVLRLKARIAPHGKEYSVKIS